MVDDNFKVTEYPVDPRLIRCTQLDALTDEYARLWRTDINAERTLEAEQLLERLLDAPGPIELPEWVTLPPEDTTIVSLWRPEFTTRINLIDPMLEALGWTDELMQREASFVDRRDGRMKRVDYALRLPGRNGQLRLVALIEAKHEGLRPDCGLEQVKAYAAGHPERIRFVFSTNGLEFVRYDRRTKTQSGPYPLDQFPMPDELADLLIKRGKEEAQ
jgi:hypothetical protein